jgi:hypothetical protein
MASQIYNPPNGMTPIEYIGAIEFRDMYIPKSDKDPWGADTLERQMRGPACIYDSWYNQLGQGAVYKDSTTGVSYYVQSWSPVQDKIFPGATIVCKGLSAGLPKVLIKGGQVDLSGTITCTTPQQASRTVRYTSWRTVYRYITNSKPTAPSYTAIDVNIDPNKNIFFSQITLANGSIVYGNAPGDLVTALTTIGFYDLASLDSCEPILGTPYYECQDTVTRFLPIQG